MKLLQFSKIRFTYFSFTCFRFTYGIKKAFFYEALLLEIVLVLTRLACRGGITAYHISFVASGFQIQAREAGHQRRGVRMYDYGIGHINNHSDGIDHSNSIIISVLIILSCFFLYLEKGAELTAPFS